MNRPLENAPLSSLSQSGPAADRQPVATNDGAARRFARLEAAHRREPGALLGVLQYWLGPSADAVDERRA